MTPQELQAIEVKAREPLIKEIVRLNEELANAEEAIEALRVSNAALEARMEAEIGRLQALSQSQEEALRMMEEGKI